MLNRKSSYQYQVAVFNALFENDPEVRMSQLDIALDELVAERNRIQQLMRDNPLRWFTLSSPDINAYAELRFQSGVYNPLTYAAGVLGDHNCVKALLKAKADPNECYVKGEGTAIAAAQAAGYVNCMKILLEAKSNPNRQISACDNLLTYAARRGLSDQIQLLVSAKADVSQIDDGVPFLGSTALDIAQKNHDDVSIAILKKAKEEQSSHRFFPKIWEGAICSSSSELKDSVTQKKFNGS